MLYNKLLAVVVASPHQLWIQSDFVGGCVVRLLWIRFIYCVHGGLEYINWTATAC